MAIFYPDFSGHQTGLSLKGTVAGCCKNSEGTYYENPDYERAKGDAAKRGAFFFAYHFLVTKGFNGSGGPAEQAAFAFKRVGKTPLMLDVEVTGTSRPNAAEVKAFVEAYRKLGGVIHLIYLPHWYWQEIGSPSLRFFNSMSLWLVSSDYTTYSNKGPGWVGYGGAKVAIWQYTDRLSFNGMSVDFNAFKGRGGTVAKTLADFRSIVSTGHYPRKYALNRVKGLTADPGPAKADLSWDAAPSAKSYRVIVWQKRKHLPLRKRVSTFEIRATSIALNNLKGNATYQVTVLALPASPYALAHRRASVTFHTSPEVTA